MLMALALVPASNDDYRSRLSEVASLLFIFHLLSAHSVTPNPGF